MLFRSIYAGQIVQLETKNFEPQMSAKNLTLETNLSSSIKKLKIFTSRQRLDQILINFMSNAIKFTDLGTIKLVADFSERDEKVSISDNLTLVSHFLKDSGARLTFANIGSSALDEISSQEFDLVLMDIQMPETDGPETKRIRRKRGFTKPVITLTANAQRSDHDKCRLAGCDDVLTKPVSKQKLLTAVQFYT